MSPRSHCDCFFAQKRGHEQLVKLLVDLNELVFSLVAFSLDLVLLSIAFRLRAANEQAEKCAGETAEEASRLKSKMAKQAVVRMLMRSFGFFTLTVASLAIAVEIVGLVLGVNLIVLLPGWVVLTAIFTVITRRMMRKRKLCWFKFLCAFFLLSCVASCLGIGFAVFGLRNDWSNLLRVLSQLHPLASATATSATPLLTSESYMTSTKFVADHKLIWRVALGIVRVPLIFILLLINLAKTVATFTLVKAWSKRPKSMAMALTAK